MTRAKRHKSGTLTEEMGLEADFGNLSCIAVEDPTIAIDLLAAAESVVEYEVQRKQDVKKAIQRVSTRSEPFPQNLKSLEKILTAKNFIYNLPSKVLPTHLRLQKSSVSPGTTIKLGNSSAPVKQELGRGAYGCVLLLESDGNSSGTKAAVKAQTPAGSLAWEYEILNRLRTRCHNELGNSTRIPFPAPLSFVALADGALLTMEAVSTSGLNFIDLINVHRQQYNGGQAIPEILALHYVSRMMDTLTSLHWTGHVLVRLL